MRGDKIIGVLLAILLVLNSVYLSVAYSISDNAVKTQIKDNLLSGFIYDENGNKTDIFYTLLKLTTLDEDTILKLMENDTVNSLLTDLVDSIYDYNLTGDDSYKYDGDKIIRIVEENMDNVLREINYEISDKDRDEVLKYVRTHTDYIIDTIYKTDIGDYRHD